MDFLKLEHTEYQVSHKTHLFWVKVVYIVPNVQTLAGHAIGTIHLAPTTTLHFDTVLKTKYLFPHLDFLFAAKIRLEITDIWWCVSVKIPTLLWTIHNDTQIHYYGHAEGKPKVSNSSDKQKTKSAIAEGLSNCRLEYLSHFFYAKRQVFRSFFLGYVWKILHFCWVYAN